MPTKKKPLLTYDPQANAVALQLRSAPRGARPITREVAPGFRLDFLGDEVIAIEIFDARERFAPGALDDVASPEILLTMAEAVKESRRQPTTLRSAIAAGKLRAVKRGRDWMIPLHELWNYLEALAPAGRPTNDKRAPQRKRVRTPAK